MLCLRRKQIANENYEKKRANAMIKIETGRVDAEPEAIAELLRLLGHPEALVTDLATFLDFLGPFEYPALYDAQRHLDAILPVTVPVDTTLVDAIDVIRQSFPHWPKIKID